MALLSKSLRNFGKADYSSGFIPAASREKNVAAVMNGYPDVVLDPNGKDTDYDYDALGWLNQVTDPLEFVTKYTYDANGNVTKIEKQANSGATSWQTTNFTYTRLNHVLTVTDPLSRVTTYAYDDNENLKTVTDNNSKVTNYVYDERNMLFTATDDNAGVTRYDYDINGKLAKVIDAETNDTEYAYDLFDRLTETKYADNSTEGYSYDKNSNLNVLTRPDAATITHTYDALNRLTAKDYSDSTPDVTYSYDLGSRILTADNSASELDFGYDNLNRVEDVTQRLNSTNRLVQYTYDDAGRRQSLTYPSTKVISYTYDDNSNLDLVKIGSVTLADYDYDTLNRRSAKTFSHPTTDQAAVYTFDIGNQLTSIANKVLPSTNIANYAYTSFDSVGNRTQMQRTYTTGSAVSTNYSYNDIYELTGTSGAQSHSLTYDSVGNRDVADSVTYTPNNLNQYTAVGSATYTNSSNGNITSDGTSTFGYDADNRLVSFDTTGTSNDATYAYDALGRRVKKTVNGTSTYFVYDGDDVIADYSSGSLLREYIYGDAIDEILAMQDGSNTYYYHYDGLGSVTEITDDSGAIIENYTYDVFGVPSVTTSSINNRYRFTGREYDEESGLSHYRHRTLHHGLGRFMQRDPIGYYDSMNLFSYVGNDPINMVDPYGLYKYETTSLGMAFLHESNPFNTDGAFYQQANSIGSFLGGDLAGALKLSGQSIIEKTNISGCSRAANSDWQNWYNGAQITAGAAVSGAIIFNAAGVGNYTVHALIRSIQRGISPTDIKEALESGKKYFDPKHNSDVYKFGENVVATAGKAIKTVYQQLKPSSRWIPY